MNAVTADSDIATAMNAFLSLSFPLFCFLAMVLSYYIDNINLFYLLFYFLKVFKLTMYN